MHLGNIVYGSLKLRIATNFLLKILPSIVVYDM
jgi:hypothetical protein